MDNSKNSAHRAAVDRLRNKQRFLSGSGLAQALMAGDIRALAEAITLVESSRADHQKQAEELINTVMPHRHKSFRLGLTGVPGVGKSTFIEAFGQHLLSKGHKLAVLAIDPSSQRSKGSILGDKTRMETLSQSEGVFIRPSPSADSLGGVARKTRESIILCEAAGFDYIIVETVGVGQSEVEVKSMVDFFLLLMLAGAGDELQGIKRGIMEMADGLAITKVDGQNGTLAKQAQRNYKNALHLLPQNENGWITEVMLCSALQGDGFKEIYDHLRSFEERMTANGFFDGNRMEQSLHWMKQTIANQLQDRFNSHPDVQLQMPILAEQVKSAALSPFRAARLLLEKFFA